MNNEIKVFINSVEDLGWGVEEEEVNQYRLSKYSPAGQDFSISVEGEDFEELVDSIYEAYKDFDVSEETYLWLDESGHGANGAPYDIKDLLKDMEDCEQMILNLYNNLT